MSFEGLREYRRDLALHCLANAKGALTAGDLVELMSTCSKSEDHPPACWFDIDGALVSGIMSSLKHAGAVCMAGTKYNPRHGRDEPLWALVDVNAVYPMPDEWKWEGDPNADESVAGEEPPRMTPDQVLALLQAQDEQIAAAKQFFDKQYEIHEKVRGMLYRATKADST